MKSFPSLANLALNTPFSLRIAGLAGLCWAGTFMLVLFGNLRAEEGFWAAQRIIFYMLTLAAGLLTFVPIERRLKLTGLTIEGVAGTWLLLYTIACVPAPTEWMLHLPDLPVYAMLVATIFWSVAAIATPFVYLIGTRIFPQRAKQADLRRVKRQAHEIGLLVAAVVAFAALRVLTLISFLLLLIAIIIAEMLFLSQVKAEPNTSAT